MPQPPFTAQGALPDSWTGSEPCSRLSEPPLTLPYCTYWINIRLTLQTVSCMMAGSVLGLTTEVGPQGYVGQVPVLCSEGRHADGWHHPG